jgi:GDP-4-dehydro-6-deoxy-D-mannose reductase
MDVTTAAGHRRVLITGVTGFAGSHLAEALLSVGGCDVAGLSRRGVWPAGCEHLADRVTLYDCDVREQAAVEAVLRHVRPEQVYHLAGYSRVGRSYQEPDATWVGNLGATRALYDAVARWGGRPRILFVGSGLVYGTTATPAQPVDECCVLKPESPYAASKAAADLASYQYSVYPGLDIVRARPFNHIGPRQQPGFAVPDFARQLVEIERGRRPPVLETGDLRPRRDLTDVRDTVAAYLLLMERGRTGEAYNVGRGEGMTIGAVLQRLLELAGPDVEVRTRLDPVRATEVAAACADVSKLRRETGWTPRYALEQTLADTLAWWRGQG